MDMEITNLVATVAVGVSLAGLILRQGVRLDARIDRVDKHLDQTNERIDRVDQGLAGLRERMAKLEGLLEGLREAVTGKRAA